ncbi:TPA: hypothetical protein IAC10_07965 [Candidatus Scatousia excrementigallinarum]|uniref:Uncharacterized protein n=1 Tax=Candidatus Scatousia excrementigallinarum TaxID=2840935 RepID=A0A9D1EZG4_9BACT|nr:hypothetical protein [Candidatus Scatousia excrementigallinarum]
MDKSLLKLVLLISAFIGGLCGILTIIPYVGQIVFWVLLCLASVIVMTFLMRVRILELFTVQESVTLGAIIGFVSFMVFCIIYVPAVVILMKFFNYYSNYGVSIILSSANFWIILILSVFMAVLSATLNAFSGFLTFYVKEFIKTLDKNEERRHNQFK